VVPESFRRFREAQPDVEFQLNPLGSSQQLEAIRSGRLDAGFTYDRPRSDPELNGLLVAMSRFELAAPAGHPLTKRKEVRLRDLIDVPFVWFPRWGNPALYDRLMHACFRGGLKSPRIVQEGFHESTILGLVATGLGVAWVLETAGWRRPEGGVIMPVIDLNVQVPLELVWRKENRSPLLARFVVGLQRLPYVRALKSG
jgi:DNA-binding transcriptional LysR family regulator